MAAVAAVAAGSTRRVARMTGPSRSAEVLALLSAGDPATPLVERVCEIGVRLLGVSGAGMTLVGGPGPRLFVHGTDALIEDLEDLQALLGQGPGIEAVRTSVPVLVPTLEGRRLPAWQTYADRAVARGVRALFTFPLRSGPVQLGALDLYRLRPGPLAREQVADAVVLTDIATRSLLSLTARAGDGTVSARHWLTAGRRYLAARTPGRAADVGITVDQIAAGRAGRQARATASSMSATVVRGSSTSITSRS